MAKRDRQLRALRDRQQYTSWARVITMIITLLCLGLSIIALSGTIEPHASKEMTEGSPSGAMWYITFALIAFVAHVYYQHEERVAEDELRNI